MSGEDNNNINTQQLMIMLNNRFNSIEENNINMNISINNNINSLKADMNNFNYKFETTQAEVLAKIAARSRVTHCSTY